MKRWLTKLLTDAFLNSMKNLTQHFQNAQKMLKISFIPYQAASDEIFSRYQMYFEISAMQLFDLTKIEKVISFKNYNVNKF